VGGEIGTWTWSIPSRPNCRSCCANLEAQVRDCDDVAIPLRDLFISSVRSTNALTPWLGTRRSVVDWANGATRRRLKECGRRRPSGCLLAADLHLEPRCAFGPVGRTETRLAQHGGELGERCRRAPAPPGPSLPGIAVFAVGPCLPPAPYGTK
jgi:hypothetical protein